MRNPIRDLIDYNVKYGFAFRRRHKLIRSYFELDEDKSKSQKSKMFANHVKNAYHKSIFYKELYDSYGVNINQIQNIDDIKNLPSITKSSIKNYINKIYIGNSFKHTAFTSGTTGTPLKIYYSIDCILNEAAYNEVFRNQAGHFFGDKVISLRGALDGSKKEYYDRFSKTLYLSSYHLTPNNAKWYYKKIREFEPKTILGYPSSLEALSMILSKYQTKIPIAFTSSETLYPHQQEIIENNLGCKIYDRYGNAERTISLVQEEHRGKYVFPKLYSVNEFIAKQKIYTTNLINPQFPLIRYEVNDEIIISDKNKIERIAGRIDDCLITPDRRRIGSAAMSLALKKASNIMLSQIHQVALNKIKVNIVPRNDFSSSDIKLLEKEIIKRVGENIEVEIRIISEKEIIKSDANKYKLIISEINTLS